MSEDMSQFQRMNSLWKYFSGYEYDSRILENVGIMDKEEYQAFVKEYCLQKEMPSMPTNFHLLPTDFKNGFCADYRFKKAFDLLLHAMLPLKMKRWELGMGFKKEGDVALPSFKEIVNVSRENRFKKDMELRWDIYLFLIIHTIEILRQKELLQKAGVPLVKASRHANALDTCLRKLLKGVGEYFFSKETIWYAADDENSQNAYISFSTLFDVSNNIPTEQQMKKKELEILKLAEKAVVWNPFEDVKTKMSLFDELSDFYRWFEAEQKKPVINREGIKTDLIQSPLCKNKFYLQERKRIKRNLTCFFLNNQGVSLTLFYYLGLISKNCLFTLNEKINEVLFSRFSTDKENQTESETEQKFEQNDSKEQDLDDDTFDDEFFISLYDPDDLSLAKEAHSELVKQGFVRNFDLMGCLHILQVMNPIIAMKSDQFRNFSFQGKTADVLRFDSTYKFKDFEKADDALKASFLSCCICATVQDLKAEEKNQRAFKLAEDLHGNLVDITDGVPEYYHALCMERLNQYFSKHPSDTEDESKIILLGNIAKCFLPCHFSQARVSSAQMPQRLTALRDLANAAIFLNPVWTTEEKEEFWSIVSKMKIQTVPYVIKPSWHFYKKVGMDGKTRE